MSRLINIFFIQLFVFFNQRIFTNSKALLGYNIREVTAGEYLTVVCIVNRIITLYENVICTGTLISQDHILTAAHCFDDVEINGYVVNIGSHHAERCTTYYPIWWINYDAWATSLRIPITFPQNDIAIIKIFGLPLQINPMPLGNFNPIELLFDHYIDVVGCGRINNGSFPLTKQATSLTVISTDECEAIITRLHGSPLILTERILCTHGTPFTFFGGGDSGSPVLYYNTIIAVGLSVCPIMNGHFHPDKVNLHLNIFYYADFIHFILEL